MDCKQYIAEKLNLQGFDVSTVAGYIETPPDTTLGDYALPCFFLAKVLRNSPVKIAENLKADFKTDDVITEVNAVSGYLNFKIDRKGFTKNLLNEIAEKGERFGSSDLGAGKTICIDYSSINIAKPFHIGHLSTTVIGSALCKILRFFGV